MVSCVGLQPATNKNSAQGISAYRLCKPFALWLSFSIVCGYAANNLTMTSTSNLTNRQTTWVGGRNRRRLTDIMDVFNAFDSDGSKTITQNEFKNGVSQFILKDTTLSKNSDISSKKSSMNVSTGDTEVEHFNGFLSAFTKSTAMILATELGDKTFFIAAVLSMKNDRLAVFGGGVLALYAMTILSTMMGMVLPNLLPRQYTHILGGLLFLYFGVKLLIDSKSMSHKVSDELEEVEDDLLKSNKKEDNENEDSLSGNDEENKTSVMNGNEDKRNYQQMEVVPGWEIVFVQSMTLCFFAEWGDRSQIATIALAAHHDPIGVTVGGCIGHTMCTGLACVGGRLLASQISEKTVTFWGGVLFLAFGLHSFIFES